MKTNVYWLILILTIFLLSSCSSNPESQQISIMTDEFNKMAHKKVNTFSTSSEVIKVFDYLQYTADHFNSTTYWFDRIPTWLDSNKVCYFDESIISKNTIKLAKQILKNKLKSKDVRDRYLSLYLFTLFRDTSNIETINENLIVDSSGVVDQKLVDYISNRIEINQEKQRIGLFCNNLNISTLPEGQYLEKYPHSRFSEYFNVLIDSTSKIVIIDRPGDNLKSTLENSEKDNVVLILTVHRNNTWSQILKIVEEIKPFSDKKNIEIYLRGKAADGMTMQPDMLGLLISTKDQDLDKTSKQMDKTEILINATGHVAVNWEVGLSSLELKTACLNKRITLTAHEGITLNRIYPILSLIKSAKPVSLVIVSDDK